MKSEFVLVGRQTHLKFRTLGLVYGLRMPHCLRVILQLDHSITQTPSPPSCRKVRGGRLEGGDRHLSDSPEFKIGLPDLGFDS